MDKLYSGVYWIITPELFRKMDSQGTPRGRCDKSFRAEFQNSMCDIDFFFQQKTFPEQFGWAAREWPKFAALFL